MNQSWVRLMLHGVIWEIKKRRGCQFTNALFGILLPRQRCTRWKNGSDGRSVLCLGAALPFLPLAV